jgi:transcriptional regulator with XRE-family HTH domain
MAAWVNPHAFGQILVRLRKQIGLTRDELAERMGSFKRMTSYFEPGKTRPSYPLRDQQYLAKMIQALTEQKGHKERPGGKGSSGRG